VGTPATLQTATHTQLERLYCCRKRRSLRLTNKQMNVFWHDDISQNYQAIAVPNAFQYLQQQITTSHDREQRSSLVATERQEVEFSSAP
jgi:hypothetical protein